MENEINISEENNMKTNENNNPENILKKVSNKDNLVRNTSVTELKNMFNLNQNNSQIGSNNFHNSLKLFTKNNLVTNVEQPSLRTLSKEHMNSKLNKNNFPSKANVCKGNMNNNIKMFCPPESSPIVQYFKSVSRESQDLMETGNNLGYLASPKSPGFNFSPSLIFNKKNKGSDFMGVKSRKSIEPISLNDSNEIKFFEDDEQNKFEVTYNEEDEINNEKEDKKIIGENNIIQRENKLNTNQNEENKNELNELKNSDISPIQNAMKKLKGKKSKLSDNKSNDEEENRNQKMNINQEYQYNRINNIEEKWNSENGEMFVKNVLNDMDDGLPFDEKNTNMKTTQEKTRQEINDQNYFSNNNLSNLNNFTIKRHNNDINKNRLTNIQINPNNNISNINYNHYMLNNMNQGNFNNPNLINNNYINNNLNNNYKNSYIQFNYMMYNNPNLNPNFNFMMNHQPNIKKNNNNINNRYIPQNMINLNNSNYNLSQRINPNNMHSFNNNNNDFKKYNQIMPNTGNINIQNNYFLYNNNQENINKNENVKEEKQKKKKKKKIKKLEQNTYKDQPMEYYLQNFIILAKDQGASRYLQDLLVSYPPDMINSFYELLCKNIMQLINDPFANYLIQKLICLFTQEQLFKLLHLISPSFFGISCDCHGTRVLQKLIELIKTPELRNLFYELVKPNIFELLKDLNGTYIVQKFANSNMNEYGLIINAIIIENSVELCKHRHGCCVIQKYLEIRDPYMLPQLTYKLLDGFSSLITDQFGNYVIKTILVMDNPDFSNIIGEKIYNNISYYSKHKYSSNIVEKCFDFCRGICLNKLIGRVQQEQCLKELILDEHGNYVVQKVLSISSKKKKEDMLSIIKGLFHLLKQTHFGEKIIHRICSTYPNIYDI